MADGADGTKERPKIHSGKKGGKIKGVKKARQEGCGAWYFQTIPDPAALTTPKKLTDGKVNTGLDTVVYFFPNPENACRNYAFVQFAKRTTTKLGDDGTDSGEVIAGESHDWQPDVEGWDKRVGPKFLDIGEIVYNGKRVKKTKPDGMRREDRPGYRHPPGKPPTPRKIRWEFIIYVICDDGAKTVGKLEYAIEVVVDKAGRGTLHFPDKDDDDSPKLTKTCCRVDDDFTDWIDRWHAHEDLKELPEDPKERRKALKAFGQLVRQSATHRRPFMNPFARKKKR